MAIFPWYNQTWKFFEWVVRLKGRNTKVSRHLVKLGIQQIFAVESGILGLESGIQLQLKKSGIPLTIGIRNSSSTDKESTIQYLESRIHGMEFRI